ncbi:MAG: Crp/Fnr family transcriptional regulator [Pyrinomonadaceae bacterium]
MFDKIEILKRTELFGGLDESVLNVLASRMVERRLERNAILFIEDEPAKGLYVIAEGSVRAFRSGADGREQVIHVERAVTTIAELPVFDDGRYPSTVAAEAPSVLFYIGKEDIRAVSIAHPEVALAAAKLLATRLRRCAALVESLSLLEVGQRLAKLFLQEAAITSSGDARFTQTLTHNQLAARIGTVREVVSRSLLRLQTDGLIRISGKTVTIPDTDALRRYADR